MQASTGTYRGPIRSLPTIQTYLARLITHSPVRVSPNRGLFPNLREISRLVPNLLLLGDTGFDLCP